jgi:hypothetical protein
MVVSYTGYPHTQSLAMASVGIFMLQYYKRLFGATI